MDSLVSGPGPDAHLDLTEEICPMTYVRVRLALDGLAPDQALQVRLAGEAATQVPRTATRQGYTVSATETDADGACWCRISRG